MFIVYMCATTYNLLFHMLLHDVLSYVAALKVSARKIRENFNVGEQKVSWFSRCPYSFDVHVDAEAQDISGRELNYISAFSFPQSTFHLWPVTNNRTFLSMHGKLDVAEIQPFWNIWSTKCFGWFQVVRKSTIYVSTFPTLSILWHESGRLRKG